MRFCWPKHLQWHFVERSDIRLFWQMRKKWTILFYFFCIDTLQIWRDHHSSLGIRFVFLSAFCRNNSFFNSSIPFSYFISNDNRKWWQKKLCSRHVITIIHVSAPIAHSIILSPIAKVNANNWIAPSTGSKWGKENGEEKEKKKKRNTFVWNLILITHYTCKRKVSTPHKHHPSSILKWLWLRTAICTYDILLHTMPATN